MTRDGSYVHVRVCVRRKDAYAKKVLFDARIAVVVRGQENAQMYEQTRI